VNALVVGASGRVGRRILQRLRARGDRAVGTFVSRPFDGGVRLDVGSAPDVERIARETRPHVVFLAGGLTHVDACEERPDEALRVNVDGTAHVVRACGEAGAYLLGFSTDYVFDGADGPYAESAAPAPLSHYGFTKLAGEQLVLNAGLAAAVARTSMVYEFRPGDGNFLMFVYDRLAAGRPALCYTDQFGTPSSVEDVAAAAVEIADRRLTGLIHVAGPDFMSRAEFGRAVAAAFGMDARLIQEATTRDRPQQARRPVRAGLRTDRMRTELKTRMRGLADALRASPRGA
jgi:dTDP-4-dehydrorhamnose reductase